MSPTSILHPAPALPSTLLGQRAPRIPTGGKIRAGIQVLTRAAANNPGVRALYEQGLAQQASFEQIGQRIAQAFPDIKRPLVPKNVSWFTVRPGDFPNPALPAHILAQFGEDRGDGVVRLYRFPVVFPADSWQAILPHEFACWGRNEKRYWSEYADDGRTRHCKMFAPVKTDPQQRRVPRTFGGRTVQLRPDNGGLCQPECCPEFQARQCNLSGRFIFYIPGIRSADAFELHTNSYYALSRAMERFATIAFMRGGRIAGFLDAQRTPFYLTKVLREVSHIDPESGQSVRTEHWIIELEAPVDVTALIAPPPLDEHRLQLADQSAKVLQPSPVQPGTAPPASSAPEPDGVAATGYAAAVDSAPAKRSDNNPAHDAAQDELETIYALAAECGVPRERFDAYADWHWGAGWRRNARGRAQVQAELQRYAKEPQALQQRIDEELKH